MLAGVLILGGIAAIASAAGKNRERSYPEPEPYPEDAGYQAPPPYRAGGMSAAVDTCVAEVEAQRGAVGSVDRASRSSEGWYVAGELRSGAGYSCWVDQDGRVTDIEADDYGASYDAPADDPQEARASTAFVSKQRVPEAADDAGYELAQAEVAAN